MSAELEHRECAEALGAYALGALPDSERERVQAHLSECSQCRAELDWLRPAVDALPASVSPIPPPPELKARIMEIVEAEAELLRAAGERADRVPPARRRPRWRWPVALVPRPALALGAAGLAAVALAAGLLATRGGGGGTRTVRAQIVNPTLARRVQASLQVRGTRAVLVVKGLPTPAGNHVDQCWIKHGSAAPEPAGTFVLQSGAVEVGRPVHRGDLVLVTVERGRGSRRPTTSPFMVAKV